MKKLFWITATVIYLVFLTSVSLRPGDPSGEEFSVKQIILNAAHVPAYFLLTVLLSFWFKELTKLARLTIICFPLIYGVMMEMGQSYVPYRYASLSDIALNALGIVCAVILIERKFVKVI